MRRFAQMRMVVCVALALAMMAGALLIPDATARAQGTFTLALEPFISGVRLPVFLTHAGDGSGRIFVVQKTGQIRIIKSGALVEAPFLDVSSKLTSVGFEQGLLGLAFHPRYKDNGFFFFYYSAPDRSITIARYRVSANPDLADPASGKVLLSVPKPYVNHNGGMLVFGPDGYLYTAFGDGGSGGDPLGSGQNTKSLLGKMLRLDVDSGDPYGIPKDNPFADGVKGLPEIWNYGLRNAWRFSFDRATGNLFIGDVGQDRYEEIDFVKAGSKGGLNFGWNTMEGLHCFNPRADCDQTGLTLPIAEYSHSQGISVTGGYVYRGMAFPNMQGYYFYGDYGTGRIWSLHPAQGDSWENVERLQAQVSIGSFGEDEAGELYLCDLGNATSYRLVDNSAQ